MNPKFYSILQTLQLPPIDTEDIAERFALERFAKKFEVPDNSKDDQLHLEAWETFLETDKGLKLPARVDGIWYKVREELHSLCYHTDFQNIDFPKGSEFKGTRGFNSIESRLEKSEWTVTLDCFDLFATTVYNHLALKRAFRKRFNTFCLKRNINPRHLSKYIWNRWQDPFLCFKQKLSLIVKFERGSRFSTVPKNNKVRRPINIECFGNMIVQKVLGNSFRSLVKDFYGNDLATLQDVHKGRLVDKSIATIDLKNASDSINLDLIRFLFPQRVLKHVLASRSEMILGPDGNYHWLTKVSSMGNGFTFELMTLVLTALCRQLDCNASVYGDDIIIDKTKATQLIQHLTNVGFQVNLEKSFIDGPFRESCGGNYDDRCGYIESYDFVYPKNTHDCVVFFNKLYCLRRYSFFHGLYKALQSVLDPALHGPVETDGVQLIEQSYNPTRCLDGFFHSDIPKRSLKKFRNHRMLISERYHYDVKDIIIFYGFRYVPKMASRQSRDLHSRQVGKYMMYLHAGRVCKDILEGSGSWVKCVYVSIEGRVSTLSSLIDNR